MARALLIVARILARFRTIAGSARRRATSSSPKAATTEGSKEANAFRKPSRLRRMVSQESPLWKPSRQSFSKMRVWSTTGRPHSSS